jgi:COP9 signalosome complex subunit 7
MADALQSFLALAKGARGRAAVAVIADATAAPGLFAFGELLDVPNIKEARRRELSAARLGLSRFFHILTRSRAAQLAGTEFAPALELLRLFAYGTLADYKGASAAGALLPLSRGAALTGCASFAAAAASSGLPPLQPAQLLKLKQLTVASLAEETKARPARRCQARGVSPTRADAHRGAQGGR